MDQRLHGGILNYEEKQNGAYLDYSVNINPLGLPEFVKTAIMESIPFLERYPDPECRKLCRRLAEVHGGGLEENRIICGNGAADLIYQLVNCVRPRRAMVPAPTFSEYELALGSVGCEVRHFLLSREEKFRPDLDALCQEVTPDLDLLFFCNPNNPTGICVSRESLGKLVETCEKNGVLLVVDECFQDFLDEPERATVIPLLEKNKNLFVLRAFTKIYAMAGLRLGYLLVSDPVWKQRLRERRQPWNVSLAAQEAGYAALGIQGDEYVARARELILRERRRMSICLRELGYLVYPSEANFLFFEVPWEKEEKGETLFAFCMKRKILIRDCSNYRGVKPGSYRVCVRTERENEILLSVLEEAKRAEEKKKKN